MSYTLIGGCIVWFIMGITNGLVLYIVFTHLPKKWKNQREQKQE